MPVPAWIGPSLSEFASENLQFIPPFLMTRPTFSFRNFRFEMFPNQLLADDEDCDRRCGISGLWCQHHICRPKKLFILAGFKWCILPELAGVCAWLKENSLKSFKWIRETTGIGVDIETLQRDQLSS